MSDRYYPRRKFNYKKVFSVVGWVMLPILVLGLIYYAGQSMAMDNIVRVRVTLRYGAALISLIGVCVILYCFIGVFLNKGKKGVK